MNFEKKIQESFIRSQLFKHKIQICFSLLFFFWNKKTGSGKTHDKPYEIWTLLRDGKSWDIL